MKIKERLRNCLVLKESKKTSPVNVIGDSRLTLSPIKEIISVNFLIVMVVLWI